MNNKKQTERKLASKRKGTKPINDYNSEVDDWKVF